MAATAAQLRLMADLKAIKARAAGLGSAGQSHCTSSLRRRRCASLVHPLIGCNGMCAMPAALNNMYSIIMCFRLPFNAG